MVHLYRRSTPRQLLCLVKDGLTVSSQPPVRIQTLNLQREIRSSWAELISCSHYHRSPLGKTWISTRGRGDGAVTRFSDNLFFREWLLSFRLALKTKSHRHRFPTLRKLQGPRVLHTALWCKTRVHVETQQLKLWFSSDKAASRVRILPTNTSVSKKVVCFILVSSVFCLGFSVCF